MFEGTLWAHTSSRQRLSRKIYLLLQGEIENPIKICFSRFFLLLMSESTLMMSCGFQDLLLWKREYPLKAFLSTLIIEHNE